MLLERISSEKFTAFQQQKISELHQVIGGRGSGSGTKSLGGGSCEMSYGSDTTSGGLTTYHDASYEGEDCPG